MLIGIPSLIFPDLLIVLCGMGCGDEIARADGVLARYL